MIGKDGAKSGEGVVSVIVGAVEKGGEKEEEDGEGEEEAGGRGGTEVKEAVASC